MNDFPSSFVHEVENEVQNISGYLILGASVLYYEICPDCQKDIQLGEQ